MPYLAGTLNLASHRDMDFSETGDPFTGQREVTWKIVYS